MRAANFLHANMHGLVLSGVSSPCRRVCGAIAFALHFALYLGLHSVQSSGAPITAWLAADALRIAVQPVVLTGGAFRLSGPRRRAWRACAFARYTVQHLTLHFMRPSNVQTPCLEHAWPVAVAEFAGALAPGSAATPERQGPERKRGAKVEGKIEGCGTTVRTKPVCTWVGRGTRPRAASCRPQPPCLAVIGNSVCRIRSGALGLSGAAS